MRNSLALVVLTLIAALTACRSAPKPSAPQTELERTLYFVERDHDGDLHRISGKQAEDPKLDVAHVPWEHPVDVDSRVEVRLNKAMLAPLGKQQQQQVPELADDVAAHATRLRELIDSLRALVAARATAIESWRMLALSSGAADADALEAAFSKALAPLNAAKLDFGARIETCYPDQGPAAAKRGEIEVLFEEMMDEPTKAPALVAFLQTEIDAVDRSARAMAEAKAKGFALRLEAFLVPSEEGKEPSAIHLEGYDSIANRRVKLTDRTGVKLSSADRKRLQQLLASANELSEAANRVNDGEAELDEALDEATSELGRKLDEYLDELDALGSALERRQSEERWKKTVDAARDFAKELESLAQAELSAQGRALADKLEQQLMLWTEESGLVTALSELRMKVRAVREAWRGGTSKLDALKLTKELGDPIEKVAAALGQWAPLLEGARDTLRDSFTAWKSRFPQLREELDRRFDESAFANSLDEWRGLAGRAKQALVPLKAYAGIAENARPLDASFRVPEAIDMPLDDAPNTAIDLRRSDRRPGDRIELRATLLEDGAEKSTSSTSFTARKLGWYGELVPAVVLTTADQLAGASDSAGFSASLSWMLRHGARPYDESGWAQSARWLGWGVGIHATLLNFDPDNDAEIGIGATLGLWEGRLLFGAGINVLAESDDEGRYYYFAGSSLIPLLQALQAD